MYRKKFDAILLRENGTIKYKLYIANDKHDSHYVYFKIPSEVIPEFYYDVIIQLYAKDAFKKNSNSLRGYHVKFYSNDPAFMYTFAHTFNKNKLFIKDLEKKMPKEALSTVAKTRNPNDQVWYVKSLYFAYLAMEKYNLFNKKVFETSAIKYNKKAILDQVMYAEDKVRLRQEAESTLEKEKKKKEPKQQTQTQRNTPSRTVSRIGHTKTIKNTGTVKKSRTTKTIKRK